jgi:hypothetical protein
VWDVNIKIAEAHIGESLEVTELKEVFKEQIIEFAACKWFVKDFINFQYGNKLYGNVRLH